MIFFNKSSQSLSHKFFFVLPPQLSHFLAIDSHVNLEDLFPKNLNNRTWRLLTLFRKQVRLGMIHSWEGENERESVSHDWALRKMIH